MRRRMRSAGVTSVMFLVGVGLLASLVLIVAATAQRYLQKETIQDSADAAAMAGAIVRAKALNLIAFANLVMSARLAVYTFLKGTALGLALYLPVGSNLCAAGQLDYCVYQPKAEKVMQSYQKAKERVANELKQIAAGERQIAQAAPALALVQAYQAGTDSAFQKNYGSGLTVQTVPPGPQQLPLTDQTAQAYHDRAMQDASFIYPMGKGILWTQLNPGPQNPVATAFGFANDGVEQASHQTDAPAEPLRLSDDWKSNRFFRTQSQLMQDNAQSRVRLANVLRPPSSGGETTTTATSQAEFFAFYGHEDLWHMDWRARLSLSKPFVNVPGNLQRYWVH